MDESALFRLRRQIVQLKQNGLSGAEIESVTGVRQNRVSEIWRLYLNGGTSGLRPQTRGRKQGCNTLLSESAALEVRTMMTKTTPGQAGMQYSLWARHIVAEYIRREYGVRLSLRCITNYFIRWGFVCQSPIKAAASSTSKSAPGEKFESFVSGEFRSIVKRAAAENIGIYWYSEAVVDEDHPRRKNGRPKKLLMTAGITARGTARFMFFEGSMTQEKFLTFVSLLIRYADRKIFLIAADKDYCRGRKISAWLKTRKSRIEIFYHPPSAAGAASGGENFTNLTQYSS